MVSRPTRADLIWQSGFRAGPDSKAAGHFRLWAGITF